MKILGTGSALPELEVTNDDLTRFLDTSDEWISTRTGIRSRRVLSSETLHELACRACDAAMADAGVDAEGLDFIICSTVQGEWITPGLSCAVQQYLGAHCPCVDINAACAGFIYALDIADSYIATGRARKILILCAESMSRIANWTDRSTCVLFGDGAGAAIFRLADTPFALTLGARGSDVLHAGGPSREGSAPITMDGKAVFRFAVDALPKCLHTVLDETRLTLEDLSWVVCHQANSRIIDHCIKALQADPAKFYKNMDRHGNTSAASIPVALNELAESGQLTPGRPLACIGFGGGLTWGGAIFQYKE